MAESRSDLAQRRWLRVETSLSELDALLTLVETREALNEGELRSHLLELFRRVDALEGSVARADLQLALIRDGQTNLEARQANLEGRLDRLEATLARNHEQVMTLLMKLV